MTTTVAATNNSDNNTSDSPSDLPNHSGRRALLNTAAVAVGSNLAALGRLVVIALIARQSGEVALSQFAVLIELFKLAEGVLDFGASEVFVREINQRPSESRKLMRVLTATKMVQLLPAFGVLALGVLLFLDDPVLREPGLIGGISLIAYAAVLIFRVPFRAGLSMYREMIAELLSVGTMIILVLTVARGASITTLIWAYIANRLVFGALCTALGIGRFKPSISGVTKSELAWAANSLAVIGVAGFIVGLYQGLDLLLLQKLIPDGTESIETAYFVTGQKLAWPVLMALVAVGGTLYSVIAAAWPHDKPRFNRSCQLGVDAVFLLAGIPVTILFASGAFLSGLIDADLAEGGAGVAGPIALLCVSKAVSMTVGPALFIVHKQRWVLAMLLIALPAKAAAITAVVYLAPTLESPIGGASGVAWASLFVETLFVTIPSLVLVYRFTGFAASWWIPCRAAVCAVIAITTTLAFFEQSDMIAGVLAPALYLVLLIATRTADPFQLIAALRSPDSPPTDTETEDHTS